MQRSPGLEGRRIDDRLGPLPARCKAAPDSSREDAGQIPEPDVSGEAPWWAARAVGNQFTIQSTKLLLLNAWRCAAMAAVARHSAEGGVAATPPPGIRAAGPDLLQQSQCHRLIATDTQPQTHCRQRAFFRAPAAASAIGAAAKARYFTLFWNLSSSSLARFWALASPSFALTLPETMRSISPSSISRICGR